MSPAVKGLRKRAMIYFWRAQQSGAIISITLLGTLTAASLYHDFIKAFTHNYWVLGDSELGGVLVTMVLIFTGVFGVGYAFDKLKFWKEQNIVTIERNPYGSYKLTAKEINWIRLWQAAANTANPTPEQRQLAAHFDKWVERSLEEDAVLQAEVEAVDRWVEQGDQSIKRVIEGED